MEGSSEAHKVIQSPATEGEQINYLAESLEKSQESLKHMTAEMMRATEKATYYKSIIMKIID